MLISIDTLRLDHVGRFDPLSRELTPFLDALMAEGQVAERHRSCSNWTYPAMSCGLSGRTVMELGGFPELSLSRLGAWPRDEAFLVS